jgi:hypothetical protein
MDIDGVLHTGFDNLLEALEGGETAILPALITHVLDLSECLVYVCNCCR